MKPRSDRGFFLLLLNGCSDIRVSLRKCPTYLKNWFCIIALFFGLSAAGQNYSLSGYVNDQSTGEALIGANVVLPDLGIGATTNNYGFFSISAPEGTHRVVISFIGYETVEITLPFNSNMNLSFELSPAGLVGDEVVLTDRREDQNVTEVRSGTINLPVDQITEIPVVFGEVDILKTIQLLPGVTTGNEGSSGFFVRGGGPDQNLILLDEAVVYNASHLLGFFSVFNADAIKHVDLIKGTMPAQYGGRLSSVLDIQMRDGNLKNHQVRGGIGLISSRLTAEGPLAENKASYLVSARRTYLDLFIKPVLNGTDFEGNNYFFYDVNAKLNYKLSDKDRIFISGYFGRDDFEYRPPDSDYNLQIPWGNKTGSIRWNHVFGSKLFMNATLVASDYDFRFNSREGDFQAMLYSGIRDINPKVHFTYQASPKHKLNWGYDLIFHSFRPANAGGMDGDVELDPNNVSRQNARESAIYFEDNWDINDRLSVQIGMRFSHFNFVGPFERFIRNDSGNIADTLVFNNGESIQRYSGLEPRLAARYLIDENRSIKLGIMRNNQYVHLATVGSATLPTDIWIPSSDVIAPQIGWQYSLGYFQNFQDNMFEASAEVYYRSLQNVVEYAEGVDLYQTIQDNPDNLMVSGDGEAYGLELFFTKTKGKLTGWLSYTLSKSDRFFEEINGGVPFPSTFDRRHDLSVTASYRLSEKWSLNSVFVLTSGKTFTPPKSRFLVNNSVYTEWGPRNSTRLPAFHRLDIGATWVQKKTDRYESSWTFSIYNVYNRQNVFFVFFESEGEVDNGTFKLTPRQVSLFPILPSVTWNFKFN